MVIPMSEIGKTKNKDIYTIRSRTAEGQQRRHTENILRLVCVVRDSIVLLGQMKTIQTDYFGACDIIKNPVTNMVWTAVRVCKFLADTAEICVLIRDSGHTLPLGVSTLLRAQLSHAYDFVI